MEHTKIEVQSSHAHISPISTISKPQPVDYKVAGIVEMIDHDIYQGKSHLNT